MGTLKFLVMITALLLFIALATLAMVHGGHWIFG